MREKCTLTEATASTPIEREEELLKRFDEASRAYYLLAEADRPERLEKVGRLMDRLAEELRS